MNEAEAKRATAQVVEYWPSKFHWTPAMMKLWVERLNVREWNLDQVEAVIREERATDDGAKPRMAKILQRIREAHRVQKHIPTASEHEPLSPEKWAEIFRDRENAAIWWADTVAAGETAEAVRMAGEAFPMFASSFAKFTDPAFKPTPIQCLRLKAAWQWFHDHGPRPKPAHAPGIMAGMAAP